MISKAEQIYISKSAELCVLQRKILNQPPGTLLRLPEPTPTGIAYWLAHITHNPNGRHRKRRNYAMAYYRKQKIIYNPLNLADMDSDFLLDLVLHELGHLFTYRFLNMTGHGDAWKAVGEVVGYATVGSTSSKRRRQYPTFAAHSNADVSVKPLQGRVLVENRSTVRNPVQLVHTICDTYRHESRKEIIARCVARGINPNTAATQYAKWKKDRELRVRFGINLPD